MNNIIMKIMLIIALISYPLTSSFAQTNESKGVVYETVKVQIGDDLYLYDISSDHSKLVDQYKSLLVSYGQSETILAQYIRTYGELTDAIDGAIIETIEVTEPAIEESGIILEELEDEPPGLSEPKPIKITNTINNDLVKTLSIGLIYSNEDNLVSINTLGAVVLEEMVLSAMIGIEPSFFVNDTGGVQATSNLTVGLFIGKSW